MASAVCVAGTYRGNNVFRLTVCVTVVLKVLARVEILVPSYGFCTIPPCEEFADSVCDESFIPMSMQKPPSEKGGQLFHAASRLRRSRVYALWGTPV